MGRLGKREVPWPGDKVAFRPDVAARLAPASPYAEAFHDCLEPRIGAHGIQLRLDVDE